MSLIGNVVEIFHHAHVPSIQVYSYSQSTRVNSRNYERSVTSRLVGVESCLGGDVAITTVVRDVNTLTPQFDQR